MRNRWRIAVVGRGPCGLAVALALRGHLGPSTEIVSVDVHEGWLDDWTERLAIQASAHLRSPSFHHPSLAVPLLDRWARDRGLSDYAYDTYYRMPGVTMFNEFCTHLRDSELGEVEVVTGVVRTVDARPRGCVVAGDDVEVHADAVVWCGSPMKAAVPDVVEAVEPERGVLAHSLDVDVRRDVHAGDRVVVVGGGHTAAALSLAATDAGATVTLVARQPLRRQRFDAPPGWLSHRGYRRFRQLDDPAERAALLGRPRGTVPPAHARLLDERSRTGDLAVRVGFPVAVERVGGDGGLVLRLADGTELGADRVWLATGRAPDRAALPAGLPALATIDGFPVLGPDCRWGDTPVFVAGMLARLQIGMTAGNLHGQRLAARTIAMALAP